jgi:glycosyltransferase involved in cell wall biosynthesis
VRIVVDGRVITDHFPGIGRYAYELVAALTDVAVADDILVLYTPGQCDERFDVRALASAPTVSLCHVRGDLFAPTTQWTARRAVARLRPDVVHATYWLGNMWSPAPTVLSVYDLIGRRVPGAVPRRRAAILGWVLRVALRRAAHVLTLSEWSKHDLEAAGVEADRITVTPLATDARFHPVVPDAIGAVRARLGLPERYVLYVGSNKPHKNLRTLVAAWTDMATRHHDAVAPRARTPVALVLAGRWDPRYDDVADAVRAMDMPNTVHVIGPVADVDLPALYGGADVFAFPSRYEGFGLPPLEAMACGTPVVAADATSLPEVVGDAGLLVLPDDTAAWADTIARVLTSPDLARDLGRRGIARAARFTWRETARRTLDAYHIAVARSAARARAR